MFCLAKCKKTCNVRKLYNDVNMKINNKEYKLPESLKDINLEKYLGLVKIINKEYDNEMFKTIEILSVLTEIPVDDIKYNEISMFIDIQRKLTFLQELPNNDVPESFKIDGVEYKTIKNPSEVKTGEFIDLHALTKDEKKLYDNLPMILAIFYRPVVDGKRVDDYATADTEKRKELFLKKLTTDKVFGAVFFFLNLRLVFLTLINKYSSNKMKKM